MGCFQVKGPRRIKGRVFFSGDKSIAHRSVILSALSQGKTIIRNFPANADCLSTIKAFKNLGIKITAGSSPHAADTICVFGKGLRGLTAPQGPLFIGDSGTSFRLLLGVFAGQDFKVKMEAGKSLAKRPMLRVTHPLRLMGANIIARQKHSNAPARQRANAQSLIEEYPPITIRGGKIKAITYKIPVASAQVKSAILLAALFSPQTSRVVEPIKTRDHTERMLKLFKATLRVKANTIFIKGEKELVSPGKIYIPGDLSSASFFIVLSCILSGSEIIVSNINLNAYRMGIVRVLKRMGADIRVTRRTSQVTGAEPMGDIQVKSSRLKATTVKKEEIPSLIDELPVLMVAACFASGKTVFNGVEELRVKESDRIRAMVENLQKMGADIKVTSQKSHVRSSERVIIQGVLNLKGAQVKSFGDHRIAMSMVVAGLKATGKTLIDDVRCVNKSFPGFFNVLNQVLVKK